CTQPAEAGSIGDDRVRAPPVRPMPPFLGLLGTDPLLPSSGPAPAGRAAPRRCVGPAHVSAPPQGPSSPAPARRQAARTTPDAPRGPQPGRLARAPPCPAARPGTRRHVM